MNNIIQFIDENTEKIDNITQIDSILTKPKIIKFENKFGMSKGSIQLDEKWLSIWKDYDDWKFEWYCAEYDSEFEVFKSMFEGLLINSRYKFSLYNDWDFKKIIEVNAEEKMSVELKIAYHSKQTNNLYLCFTAEDIIFIVLKNRYNEYYQIRVEA